MDHSIRFLNSPHANTLNINFKVKIQTQNLSEYNKNIYFFVLIVNIQLALLYKNLQRQFQPPNMKQKRQSKKSKPKSAPKTKSVSKQSPKPKKICKTKTLQKRQIQLDYKLEEEGLKYKIKLHKQYKIDQKHTLYKSIKNLVYLYIEKEKSKDQHYYDMTQYTYFPMFEFHLAQENPAHEKCSICQFEFQQPQDYQKQLLSKNDEDIIRLKCSHLLHWNCFKMLIGEKQWLKCPVCSTIYGYMVGDQPEGTMSYQINKFMHCDGFNDCGTITISYSMKSGTRGNISYPSTHRTAYLPDNEKGHEVLDLLKRAFDRKLIFTIGRSVTTGRDNQIVWNGIHHKTNLSGGSAYFGYPDQTYFDRVKLELAMKGIY